MNELIPFQGLIPRQELARNPQVVKALERSERLILGASLKRQFVTFSLEELAAELSKIIDWIARDIGYNIKGADDRQYIIVRTAQLLRRYYDTLSVEDFRLAFEMAVAGELEGYLPKDWKGNTDAHHYQQFSAEYVCKILNAYKSRRAAALKKAEQAAPKPVTSAVPEKDRQRNSEWMRQELIHYWLHYKYRGWFPAVSPIAEMRFYEILADAGLADQIEVTEAEQKAVLGKAMMYYAGRGMVADLKRMKEQGAGADEIQGDAFRLARRKALHRALIEITREEIQLRDYIFEKWK